MRHAALVGLRRFLDQVFLLKRTEQCPGVLRSVLGIVPRPIHRAVIGDLDDVPRCGESLPVFRVPVLEWDAVLPRVFFGEWPLDQMCGFAVRAEVCGFVRFSGLNRRKDQA